MIRIKSKRHNFRRCGIAHPKGAVVEYPDDRFTRKEIEILTAEPMLMVERIDEISALADDLLSAALTAIDDGDVTREGKPEVRALEEILGRNITAEDRDRAYEEIKIKR